MKTVLFLNHTHEQCGVWQYGLQTWRALEWSTAYQFKYAVVDSVSSFQHWCAATQPALVILNYHDATMPWLSPAVIAACPCPIVTLVHDNCCPFPAVRAHIHTDPTHPECTGHYSVGRPVPEWHGTLPEVPGVDSPGGPRIGSFGFAFRSHAHLIDLVQSQFDVATICLHVSFGHYGDQNGAGASMQVAACKRAITKPGITLEISHEFMAPKALLDWLAGNTLNAFIYDVNYGRGCASTVDWAMAVPRPIAVNNSWQFRHLPFPRTESRSLRMLIEDGPLMVRWGPDRLCKDYQRIVANVLGDNL